MNEPGHEDIHTSDIHGGNRTTDAAVSFVADEMRAVVITKDTDFLDSHVLLGRPARLILVTTRNLKNRKLLSLSEAQISLIEKALSDGNRVELTVHGIVVQG